MVLMDLQPCKLLYQQCDCVADQGSLFGSCAAAVLHHVGRVPFPGKEPLTTLAPVGWDVNGQSGLTASFTKVDKGIMSALVFLISMCLLQLLLIPMRLCSHCVNAWDSCDTAVFNKTVLAAGAVPLGLCSRVQSLSLGGNIQAAACNAVSPHLSFADGRRCVFGQQSSTTIAGQVSGHHMYVMWHVW